MNDPWLPGLLVLAAGVGAGLFAAWRLLGGEATRAQGKKGKRSKKKSEKAAGRVDPAATADLELTIADLEARRDNLYRRLRGETGEELTSADRQELELRAARTIKELEESRDRLSQAGGSTRGRAAGRSSDAAGAVETSIPSRAGDVAAGGWTRRHPLVAGFLMGAGMVAVVGILIYWAIRDTAAERAAGPSAAAAASPQAAQAAPPAAGGMPGGLQEPPHSDDSQLPITVAVELQALDERLAADPSDVMARKERALLNLRAERYFEAFRDAEILVAADPADIDGLYVQGVVRLTMGQDEPAGGLFDRVLELFPQHVQALTWKGILAYRAGDASSAVALWRRGIAAAGGSEPQIERLMELAQERSQGLAPGGAQPAVQAPPASARQVEPSGPAATAATAATAASSGYRFRLAVADDTPLPARAILFVSLRPAGGGPPVAVKRIDQPVFPFEGSLTASDGMMGQDQPLPDTGTLRVRLDTDGSASTRSEGDLEAEAESRRGELVTLTLRAGQAAAS